MADLKISQLTGATTPLAGTEVLPIVQSSTTKKVSVADLTAGRTVEMAALGVGTAATATRLVNIASTAGVAPLVAVGPNAYLLIDNVGGGNNYFDAAVGHEFSGPAGGILVLASATRVVTMGGYGVGTATFNASGTISSVSDETWKIKDGVPSNPVEMLKAIEPGYWYYNEEKKEDFGQDRQLGFYAQNIHAAIGPEAAPTPEEGKPWGYYDRSVLAVTVMALQDALKRIEALEAKIAPASESAA
jgi:hypothetical protein